MIAYKSEAGVIIRDSQGGGVKSDSLPQIFEYLLSAPEGFNVVWEIDKFVAPIIKLMPPDQIEKLYSKGKVYFGDYVFIYNQGKSLCIKNGSSKASYYWLEQYYQDEPEPELQKIVECGEVILRELSKMGVHPTKLTSSVGIFDGVFDQLNLPTYHDLPDEVCQWTWAQKGRAWTESFKLGHFENCTDLDINSCFPSVMAGLYDTRYGKWERGLDIPSDAKYIIAKGELCTDAQISPFIYANKYGHLFSPKGKREALLSFEGIDYLHKYKSGGFTPEMAWSWIPRKLYKPLEYTVNKLFGQRHGSYSKATRRILKGALNGIAGRFYQEFRDGKLGPNVNPVWGFLIEDGAKQKVGRFIKDKNLDDRVLSINTDGVLLEGDYDMVSSSKMGEWRVDAKGKALIVSSGTVFFGDKRPCQTSYDEAMRMIQSDLDAKEWHKTEKRLMTIGDAVMGWQEELGTVQEVSPGFGLIFDHDRLYKELPQSGRELLSKVYKSEPLDMECLL